MNVSFRGATRIPGPDACAPLLLAGECNPYGSDERYALHHEPDRAAGHQLQHKIFGIGARHWYLPLWRVNLCVGEWDWPASRRRAGELIAPGAPWTVVVMLGAKVRDAFAHATGVVVGEFETGFYAQLHPIGSAVTLVGLPHPSGRNQAKWAKPDSIKRARELMAEVAPQIPWGELG